MEKQFPIKRQWMIALGLLALVLFCDQYTKHIIDVKLPIREFVVNGHYAYEYIQTPRSINPPGPITVIPNFFYIVHVVNKGAAWGIFHGRMNLLTAISAVALLCMLIFFRKICDNYMERVIGLGLLMGGTFGNLLDRMDLIKRANDIHGVVDFLSVQWRTKGLEYPSFNVADSAICVGVGLICLSTFLRPEPEGSKPGLLARLKERFQGKAETSDS